MKLYLIVIFILSSCATEKQEDLDISMKLARDPTTDTNSFKTQDKSKINTTNVFQWQNHFKTLPSEESRRKIQGRVEALVRSKNINSDQTLVIARNQKSLGNMSKSETVYREILRTNPNNLDATIELAQLYLMKRNIEAAFDYIANANKIIKGIEHPKKIDLFKYKYTLALGHLYSNKRNEGHQILSELIGLDNKFMLAYMALAASYLKYGKLEMAEFIAKRGLDQKEDDPELLNILGIVSSKRGEYRKALSYFNKSLEKNPNLVSALVNRANLSINKGEYSPAEIDLDNAIKNDPSHTNAYVSKGILLKKTGRYTAAKVAFKKALDLNPESAFARYNLAVLVSDNFNDKNDALRLFYEVLQSNDQTQEIKELAKVQIQGLRDSRILVKDKAM